jgi:hypothetical protein
MSGGESGWQRHQKVVDMRGTTEVLPRSGFLGQRDLQTVEMPVEPTVGAWDNCTIGSRCSAMALMAEDGLSFAVLQAEIIWGLLVTRAIPSNVLVNPSCRDLREELTLVLEGLPRRTPLQGPS